MSDTNTFADRLRRLRAGLAAASTHHYTIVVDTPAAVVRADDLGALMDERDELIAVVREMVNGDEHFNAMLHCRYCGMSVRRHKPGCVIARAEALLARMEAVTDE